MIYPKPYSIYLGGAICGFWLQVLLPLAYGFLRPRVCLEGGRLSRQPVIE